MLLLVVLSHKLNTLLLEAGGATGQCLFDDTLRLLLLLTRGFVRLG